MNIALRGTFEQCSNVPLNRSMILIIMLEETHGTCNYFTTKKSFAHIQRREINLTCQRRLYKKQSELYRKGGCP